MNQSNENNQGTILVLGGTGKTGSRIIERLRSRGVPLRVGSRAATPRFDWEDPTTWREVLQGIQAVYIAFQPDIAVPGADKIIAELCQQAAAAGAKRLVLLSGRGEPEAVRCEDVVIKSGLQWTIVRSSWFNQNFSEGYMLEPILAGYAALPTQPVGEPFVDADDIADVAVAALTEDRHHAQIYEVTGPRLLTFAQAFQHISKAIRRPVRYEQVSMEEYVASLESANVPQEYISLLRYLFSVVLDGRNESLGDGVERALGRKAKDFTDFAEEMAEAGVWDAVNQK